MFFGNLIYVDDDFQMDAQIMLRLFDVAQIVCVPRLKK